MPSTVYKGDLVEASFGHEGGLELPHGYTSSFKFNALDTDSTTEGGIDTSGEGTEYTTLYFTGGIAGTPVESQLLRYPVGMLVGSQLVFKGLVGTNDGTEQTFDAANNATNGKVFTIIGHYVDSTPKTLLRIQPPLVNQSNHNSGMVSSVAGSSIHILPFKTPTIDVEQGGVAIGANDSAERVLTDQFVGIVNTITLPETKVDLKRFHVVGLGRDVAVQVPGRLINQGGSFEANLHDARWLYYCLGQEVVWSNSFQTGGALYRLNKASGYAPGAQYVVIDGNGGTPPTGIGVGDYIAFNSHIADGNASTDTIDVTTHMGDVSAGTWPTNDGSNVITKARKIELRRLVGFKDTGNDYVCWLDEPLTYGYDDNTVVRFIKADAASANGSPHLDPSTKVLTNPMKKLYFSKDTVPSFALEVSVRRRDVDTSADTTEVVDGGPTDTKQLTRVFRGCKVKDFSLTADTDAALRLTTNFDAALCYTDTGRLEASNKGDRYDIHRLFEDDAGLSVANQQIKRKKMGLAKGIQKPFMFYNGTIKVKGVTLGQVVSFTINGKTGVEQHYTINGVTTGDSATDQVPFAGTRNASIAIEGKTEYDMEMEIIVDDPVFYHNMRRAIRNFDDDKSDTTDDDMIRLIFTKQGASGVREEMEIIMDDYFITEAPLPIPEDKGPIKSMLKIMPKSIKVISQGAVIRS